MDAAELAALIDHTLLRPEANAAQIDALCAEAAELHTASVCVNPRWTARVSRALAGTGVRTCSVAAFPFGIQDVRVAAEEARVAAEAGAEEIDVVAPLAAIADGDFSTVEAELARVRDAVPGVVLKAILETALWPEQTVEAAAQAAGAAGCDFVKTSTGFHPSGGATVEAVRALARSARQVKASGGIRDLAAATAMLEAGATRLGCSSTRAILAEL